MQTNTTAKKTKTRTKKNQIKTLRVSQDVRKKVTDLLTKINKKELGRKVKSDALLLKSLSLIELKHMEELQENSLTNADKLEKKYRDYISINGAISKDDFIGKLINGDLGGDSASGNFS